MDVSKLLGQTIIVLTAIIMSVAAAFFLLDQFVYPFKMADIQAPAEPDVPMMPADTVDAVVSNNSITGTIAKVTIDEMVVEQKALVTIETQDGEMKQVMLPADSRAECTKKPSVTIEQLQVGATVVVSGEENDTGMIEPCKNSSDDFTITTS